MCPLLFTGSNAEKLAIQKDHEFCIKNTNTTRYTFISAFHPLIRHPSVSILPPPPSVRSVFYPLIHPYFYPLIRPSAVYRPHPRFTLILLFVQ